MAYRNPSKSSSHGKHLHDAHRQDDKYSSGHSRFLGDGTRTKETTSDTLVHRYTLVGVKREPVGGLHRHSSTEDNATSFSKPDTVLNVAYLNEPSIDPAENRPKTVAVVANTEATKSQHRSLPNIDQTDSTSDDMPQRLTTKEVSKMLPEVRPKRLTLPTPIPLVACMTNAESKRLQWKRGRLEEAIFEEYKLWRHPGGGTPDRQGNMFIDYIPGNMFSKSVVRFDDTQLVSARAPVHDAAAGTLAPPGQTEVETLRLFSAPLGTRDGGPEPLDSPFLRRQNMVDHVTHHEMEQEKRRHLELQEFIRMQMKEKEQTPRTEQEQKSISARSHCNSEVGDDPNEHGTETRGKKSKVADHGCRDSSLVDEGSLTSEQVEHSGKSDRRRRHRHKSSETGYHGQHSQSRYRHNCHSQERRRDTCDSHSHHDDRDTGVMNRDNADATHQAKCRQRSPSRQRSSSTIAVTHKQL